MAKFGTKLLSIAYVGAILLPLILPGKFHFVPMVFGHSVALFYLLQAYGKLQPEDTKSVKVFYKSIWNLFYFQYLIYPFI